MKTILAVAAIMAATGSAHAVLFTFTHTGSGSGTLNSVAFSDRAFTITSTADTVNRQSFGGGFFIDHVTSSINISGLGTFTVLSGTRTFVNSGGNIVGYSRAGVGGLDLFDGPTNAAFGSWNMLTPIGPIAGTGNLLQWSSSAVNTSGGVLFFNNGSSSATFQAVPAPASMALLGLGGLVAARRRR